MNFKEKERLIRYIFNKRQQILLFQPYVCDKEEKGNAKDLFLLSVHHALQSCSKNSRFILENEFILHNRKEWWYDYYSRSSYYRMKHKAMDEFLDCLHQ